MTCWNNRFIDRSLSSLRTRQRYQYNLYDYLTETKNKQKIMQNILKKKGN